MAESIHLIGLPKKHRLTDKHLEDVLLSGLADGHVLTYELATLLWKNKLPPTPSLALNDLTDVEIATPDAEQYVTYEPATALWKNKAFLPRFNSYEGTTDISTSSTTFVLLWNLVFPLISGKRYEILYSMSIRPSVANIPGGLAIIRSTTPTGTPIYACMDGVFHLGDVGRQYMALLYFTELAPFTGNCRYYVGWYSPSGNTIYNDGTSPGYRRKLSFRWYWY